MSVGPAREELEEPHATFGGGLEAEEIAIWLEQRLRPLR